MESSRSLSQKGSTSMFGGSNNNDPTTNYYDDRLYMEVPFYDYSDSSNNQMKRDSSSNCLMSVDKELVVLSNSDDDTIYIGRCSEMNQPWMEIKLLSPSKSASCLQLRGNLLAQSKDTLVTIFDWHHHVRPLHQFGSPTVTTTKTNVIQELEWSYPMSFSSSANNSEQQPSGVWTCTPNCISHWDFRCKIPSMRLDLSSSSSSSNSHSCNYDSYFNTIAWNYSNQEEMGVLTSNNALKIYSTRYFHPQKPIHSSSAAHSVASVGLLHHTQQNTYITWGYDDNNNNEEVQTTVKYWKPNITDCDHNKKEDSSIHDDYWCERNDDHHHNNDNDNENNTMHPTKSLSIPNLYCVRVPPSSTTITTTFKDDLIVTVTKEEHKAKNHVQLWSLSSNKEEPLESFSMKNNNSTRINHSIIAADLAIYKNHAMDKHVHTTSDNDGFYDEDELVLCCFQSNGVFTLHGIPEASSSSSLYPEMNPTALNTTVIRKPSSSDKELDPAPKRDNNDDQQQYNPNSYSLLESSSTPPSTRSNPIYSAANPKSAVKSDLSYIHHHSSSLEDTTTKDIHHQHQQHQQHHPIFHMSNDLSSGFQTIMNTNPLDDSNHSHPAYYNHPLDNSNVSNIDSENKNAALTAVKQHSSNENFQNLQTNNNDGEDYDEYANIKKTMHVPCPPLCGASFGNNGNLIVFHNGNIRSMWTWFIQQSSTNNTTTNTTSTTQTQDTQHHHNHRNLPNRHNHKHPQQQLEEEVEIEIISRPDENNDGNDYKNANLSLSDLIRPKNNNPTSYKRNEAQPSSGDHHIQNNIKKKQQAPRSMYDLMQMNAAVKIAQWGLDRDDDDSLDDDQSSSSSSPDDSSRGSDSSNSSDSSSDYDDGFFVLFPSSKSKSTTTTKRRSSGKQQNNKKKEQDIYNYYFGKHYEKLLTKNDDVHKNSNESNNDNTSAKNNNLMTRTTTTHHQDMNNDKQSSSSPRGIVPKRKSFNNNHPENNNNDTTTATSDNDTAIPTVSMLSPTVTVARRYRSIILNDQCPQLADGWQLGSYNLYPPYYYDETDSLAKLSHHSSTKLSYHSFDSIRNSYNEEEEPTKGAFVTSEAVSESYFFPFLYKRFSFESSTVTTNANTIPPKETLKNIKSSPNLILQQQENADYDTGKQQQRISIAAAPSPLTTTRQGPNASRHDTMIGNLRKLFYQNQSGGSFASVPLDQKVMQKAKTSRQSLVSLHENEDQLTGLPSYEEKSGHDFQRNRNTSKQSIRSMLTPSVVDVSMMNLTSMELIQLHRLEAICRHNSEIAQNNGQPSKASVWNLLSKIVCNVATSGLFNDDFDGWGGPSGSLGKKIIERILDYYEVQGDVQMLATIVCVFTDTKNLRRPGKQSYDYPYNTSTDRISRGQKTYHHNSLCDLFLPPNDERYDSYIRLYSNLLYGWGQLSRRAELRKHLSLAPTNNVGDEQFIPIDYDHDSGNTFDNTDFIPDRSKTSGMTFVPYCPRCHKPANPETNICNECHTYAFRCSICTNAVRGKFIICFTCGHGGHLEHIMSWFKNNTVCPTGCGCTCTLSTFSSATTQEQQLDQSVNSAQMKMTMVKTSSSSQRRSIFGPMIQNHQNNSESSLTMIGYGSLPFGAYAANSSQSHTQSDTILRKFPPTTQDKGHSVHFPIRSKSN